MRMQLLQVALSPPNFLRDVCKGDATVQPSDGRKIVNFNPSSQFLPTAAAGVPVFHLVPSWRVTLRSLRPVTRRMPAEPHEKRL